MIEDEVPHRQVPPVVVIDERSSLQSPPGGEREPDRDDRGDQEQRQPEEGIGRKHATDGARAPPLPPNSRLVDRFEQAQASHDCEKAGAPDRNGHAVSALAIRSVELDEPSREDPCATSEGRASLAAQDMPASDLVERFRPGSRLS